MPGPAPALPRCRISARHSTAPSAPLCLSPGATLALPSQLLCYPGPCLNSHMKHRRERPPSGPRNLKGEAGTGAAPGESLRETMDVLRNGEKRRRRKYEKRTICYLVILL